MPRQRLQNLGRYGLVSDLIPSQAPPEAWTSLYNVMCEDGALRSVKGERKLFNLVIRPLYHASYQGPDGKWWLIVSDGAQVYAYDVVNKTGSKISGDTAWAGGFVTITSLNGVLVVNSASDGPFYWDYGATPPANKLVALPGWDASWRCREMVAFRYYLVALGMTEGGEPFPHKLRWSNSAQEGSLPTLWIAAQTNDAGDELIGETQGKIVGGRLVRDYLWIVKEDAIYQMSWIGGEYVMRVDRMHGSVGTRLQRGFAEMNGGMVVFTTSDLLWFDGQQATSLVDNVVRKALYSYVSEEYFDLSAVFVHAPTTQLFVSVAGTENGQLTTSLVYHWVDRTWGHKALANSYGFDSALVSLGTAKEAWDDLGPAAPFIPYPRFIQGKTWDEQRDGSWNKGVYQPSVPDVILYESDEVTDPGTPLWWVSLLAIDNTNSAGDELFCQAQRVGLPIEGADGLAMITEVWPEMTGDIPVRLTFGAQMTVDGDLLWDAPIEFMPGRDFSVTPRVTGRWLAVRVESQSRGKWRLSGLTLDWQRAGER
jgi:hypothetical protein